MGKYLFHAAIMMCCLWLITLKTIIIFRLESADMLERLQYLDWGFAWLLFVIWLCERYFEKRYRNRNGVYLVTLRNNLPEHIGKIDPAEIVERARIRYKMHEQIIWKAPFSYMMCIWYKKADEYSCAIERPISELKNSLDAAQWVLRANGENFQIFRDFSELLEWIDENKFRKIPAVQRYFEKNNE